MLLSCRCWVVAGVCALTIAGATGAQETAPATQEGVPGAENPPDPAKKYADLRKSRNRATKALAERYSDLVGLQVWTDSSGVKTSGRYVAHDPDLKWIKLSVATGSGENRQVKESTLEVAKLNRTSQSRVRQIAAYQKRLDELAASEKTDGADSGLAAGAGRGESGGAVERADRAAAVWAAASSVCGNGRRSCRTLPWRPPKHR